MTWRSLIQRLIFGDYNNSYLQYYVAFKIKILPLTLFNKEMLLKIEKTAFINTEEKEQLNRTFHFKQKL